MADKKEMVRFIPTERFNGHDPGSAFSCTRSDAEAYINLDLGYIEGEKPEGDELPDHMDFVFAPLVDAAAELSEEELAAIMDEKFTAGEIKAFARDNDIDIKGATKKADIIGKVVEHLKGLQAPPEDKQVSEAPVEK